MRRELQDLLRDFKVEIVEILSKGTLLGLLNGLSVYIVNEDRQKIQCDAERRGHSWAADTLVDTLRTSDDGAFTRFMQYLRRYKSTESLYKTIADECDKRGLAPLLSPVNDQKDKSKEKALTSLIKDITPEVVGALSKGEFSSMLIHFEVDFIETDVQRIKCDLDTCGKDKAITQMIECLLHNGKKTVEKFIMYLSENKKSLFKDIEIKLEEYGLQELLSDKGRDRKPVVAQPVEEKVATDSDHNAACNDVDLPISESSGPPKSDNSPTE